MTPGPDCVALVQHFEQCRLTAYLPTPHDVPTIGWGSTGPDIRLGMKWTQQQADMRFLRDLGRFATGVEHELGNTKTNQGEFDAMVSLAYNIGVGNFGASTLLKMHKAGEHESAALQFGRWTKQKGVVLRGLVKRREAERRLYAGLGLDLTT